MNEKIKKDRITDKIMAIALKIAEGRNNQIIDSVAKQIEKQAGLVLLDLRRRPETDCTIIKFAGQLQAVLESLPGICSMVFEFVDFSKHTNTDQAMGAISSIVFIPIRSIAIKECRSVARHFARDFSEEFSHPIFFFGQAAVPRRRWLNEELHRLNSDEIRAAVDSGKLQPDYGTAKYQPSRGITLIGVRKFIVTFILYLDTADLDIAQEIADEIGAQGRQIYNNNQKPLRDKSGNLLREPGLFDTVETIALGMGQDQLTRIVCNIKDYEKPTLPKLYKAVKKVSKKYFVEVLGCNLMGYLPQHVLEVSIRKLPKKTGVNQGTFEDQVEYLINYLNMNTFGEFNPRWQIIDFRLLPSAWSGT